MTAFLCPGVRRGTIATAVAASLVVTACASPSSKSTAHGAGSTRTTSARPSAAPPVPPGDLYQPPEPLAAGRPGALIWAQRVKGIVFHPPQTAWQFLYHSRDETDRDVAVSGFAIVPVESAPTTGRSVYAWAHGTSGLGDQCAPSKQLNDNVPPYAGELVGGNALVVATDYDGLGTPGDHTYLAGRPEGRAVLDSVRAAAALPNAGRLGDVVVAGQSQGGGAALFAAQLAPTYAPELHLRGVLASAPAAELRSIATADQSSPFKGVLLLAASGLRAAYPRFPVSSFLTPAAVDELGRVAGECVDATVNRYQNRPASDILETDPSNIPAVARILDANSPGGTNPKIPIMIIQGESDEQIPITVSGTVAAKYCALGATVFRRTYPGANHDGVLDAAHDDAVAWINSRFQHQTAPTTCVPRTNGHASADPTRGP